MENKGISDLTACYIYLSAIYTAVESDSFGFTGMKKLPEDREPL